ncbi:hypothetical protein [Gorillibacterium timonense]|uniref:hypothetical protein n=1 Tax=Gorillibacterium timonense TaxID=1689269 RepID=UPI00131BC159|nr:hypothetical protein [Gorillibacterium timonense]
MNKEQIQALIAEATEEVFEQNEKRFQNRELVTETLKLSIELSALTTIKILEKLEIIE